MTPVTERLLLDPSAHVVEARVRQLDDVERVRDLGGVGERVVERLAVRPRQVQRCPGDVGPPRLGAGLNPLRRGLRRAALDHIEQLRRRGDIDKRRAVGDDCVHDGVPVATELRGHSRDRLASADLAGHPAPGPVGHPRTWRGDRGLGLGERLGLTCRLGAEPTALVPHQHRRATERRQVHQRDGPLVLQPRPGPARRASDRRRRGLDVDPQRLARFVFDAEHHDRRKAHDEGADARSVSLHRCSPGIGWCRNPDPG